MAAIDPALEYTFVTPKRPKPKRIFDAKYALKPLYILLIIFGVNRAPYLGKITRRIQCIVVLSILIGSVCRVLEWRYDHVYRRVDDLVKIMDIISLLSLGLMAACNVIVAGFQSPVLYKTIHGLIRTLDTAIDIDQSERYKICRRVVMVILTKILVPIVLMSCMEIYTHFISEGFDDASTSINCILYFFNSLISAQFIISLFCIRSYFIILNVQLQQYIDSVGNRYKTTKIEDLRNSTTTTGSWIFGNDHGINRISQLAVEAVRGVAFSTDKYLKTYMLLCDLSDNMNSFFGTQIFFVALNAMISIIKSLHKASILLLGNKVKDGERTAILQSITTFEFAVYDILILYFITLSCELIVNEAKKFGHLLDKMIMSKAFNNSGDLMNCANIVARRTPLFTAWGFFTINLSLLYSMAGTIATYLIMLIQQIQK